MSFDNSRFTFDPTKDYSGVVMQQGRVQTDADWNEWLSELSRRLGAGGLDTMGHAVVPVTTPNGFQIAADNSSGPNTIRIGVGRMYVDGILAENHGDPKYAVWDAALEENSNTPQPPANPALPLGAANSIDFAKQPYDETAAVPQGNGQYLAYLDVWRRPVTYIENPALVDVAIGVDTSGRTQTAWQVGLYPVPSATVLGSVTTPGFQSGEQVIQAAGGGAAGGATAYLVGTIPAAGPMTLVSITGTPNAAGAWTGQLSNAVFTPTALPVSSNSTVTGAVQSIPFSANEQVIQNNSLATANIIGPVPAAGPMTLGLITGSKLPTSGDSWVGQQSGAVFVPSAAPVLAVWSCSTPDSAIPWPVSSGQLSNNTVTSTPSGPCCLSTGAGYTGVENQLYRVEIHSPGAPGGTGATFKWSRENASVQTGVTGVAPGANTLNNPASILTVQSLGRDQVLGFAAGNWIEITNQANDDNCQPGELYKIDSVDVAGMALTLTTPLSANFPASSLTSNKYTRITRWDQSGKIYRADNSLYWDLDATGAGGVLQGATGIPVPDDGTVLVLENGMTVAFSLSQSAGNYLAMDYWNFSTRTTDGSYDKLDQEPPLGLHHHYTKLSIVTFSATSSNTSATNCRQPWPPASASSGGCGCCTYTVGDGVTSFGMYTSIQQAVNALNGGPGEVCILPGYYYENVLLNNLEGVVIHGCEWQTYVYSKALQPSSGGSSSGAGSSGPSIASQTQSGLPAVFTVIGCQDLEFHSFAITAADGEVGILMDQASSQSSLGQGGAFVYKRPSQDIRVREMEIIASTLPAMVARDVKQLKVEENQFSMLDVRSIYPAVFMSGQELFFLRNQVGLIQGDRLLQYAGNANNEVQAQDRELNTANSSFRTRAAGGIQIGGPSREVFVLENSIIGGSRNGITLGNFILLDANGADTYMYTGLLYKAEDPCSGGGNGGLPSGGSGGPGTSNPLGAGGVVRDLYIERNHIQDFGMSGIGPVGYFNLNQTAEVVSLSNVNITANSITSTLRRNVILFGKGASAFGYGAIGLPDVENLIIRDNTITDFGVTPGAEVCGIFVLHGQGVEISRNQIRETRDLTSGGRIGVVVVRGEDTSQVDRPLKVTDKSSPAALQPKQVTGLDNPYQANPALSYETYGGMRAGIFIALVTPLTEDGSSISAFTSESQDSLAYKQRTIGDAGPSYAPGIPALRIQENQVRMALGLALSARGRGPFTVVNNHFSTGGAASVSSGDNYAFSNPDTSLIGTDFGALTVSVMNMGVAIDGLTGGDSFSGVYGAIDKEPEKDDNLSVDAAGGAVLFTNNLCQLDATRSRARGSGSVIIFSLDHILFANNHLRVDARRETMMLDAMLFGISLQATSNRFQESARYPVLYSGMTLGLLNITSQNISSYCLRARAFTGHLVNAENLVLNSTLCRKGRREVDVQEVSAEEPADQGVSAEVPAQGTKGKVKGKS